MVWSKFTQKWGLKLSVFQTLIEPVRAMSRPHLVTYSRVISNIPIRIIRTTQSCVVSRFSWNLVGGCPTYVIAPSRNMTQHFFHQKLRKGCPISCRKFQHDMPNRIDVQLRKTRGGATFWPGEGKIIFGEEQHQKLFWSPSEECLLNSPLPALVSLFQFQAAAVNL